MKKIRIYKSDIQKTLLLALMLLIGGFVTSNWEGHIAYGWNPLYPLWLLLSIPIGILVREI